MKIYATMAASLLAVAASAQSPLLIHPTTPIGYYGWNPPSASHQTFFNMTVNTTITLQALNVLLVAPVGQVGTVELWMTNTATTYVGNETAAANWHQAASGSVIGRGTSGSLATLTCTSCLQSGGGGAVLQPGTYGCAVRYGNVPNLFVALASAQTYSNAELSVSGGAIQYTAFTSAPSGPVAGSTGWGFYGDIIYANGVFPHACAEYAYYGTGCYQKFASMYKEFDAAAGVTAASTTLSGKSLSFVPNGSGAYDVIPGLPAYPYVAPTGAAVQIAATDDGEVQQPLTIPFTYPGGLALDLFIHSNGMVSVASNNTLSGPNWVPEPDAFLSAPATGWWCWHDLNPTEAGSGFIWFEENLGTGLIYVTYLGVESYPTTSLNPSTFQYVFDPITGIVTMNFVSLDALGGSGVLQGDDWLVGYGPGGASPNPGNTDLAALLAGGPAVSLPGAEQFPLSLAVLSKPLIGTTINLVTSNETGLNLGLNYLSVVQIPSPGIDLGIIGAPGCPALVDINAGVGNVITNLGLPGLSMTISFPLPNVPSLAGVGVYSQSIWLDATANAFGVITSNGVKMVLGNF